MSKYKIVTRTDGSIRYMKDKKFTSKSSIPANVLRQLKPNNEVDDEGMDLEAPLKECIFCQAPTKMYRFINLQTIYICEEHYYDKTTGQIVQQLNKEQALA